MANVTIPDRIISAIKLCLKEFGPEEDLLGADGWPDGFTCHDIVFDTIPVPEVLRLCLVGVLGCPWAGPFEKMRWIVPFSYQSIQCCFAYQKFGPKLYIHESVPEDDQGTVATEILRKLNRACRILELKVLTSFAKKQVELGNITVANYYLRLTGMYHYFRSMAANNFAKRTLDASNQDAAEQSIDDRLRIVVDTWNEDSQRSYEGFYNTVAMIDAYFSRLEHLLVLAVPCICWENSREPLAAFVGQSWGIKYRQVFNVEADREAKGFYDRLKCIKERYRNTFAHGGFEKNGASFFVHVSHVGALPVSFSNIRESPTFRVFPVEERDFSEICNILDTFDAWLNLKLWWVLRYAESGLSLACDSESLDRLRQASHHPDKLRELIERLSWEACRHENMDY